VSGARAASAYPAAVRIHVCRHAEAAPGEPDAERPLTSAGADTARRLGQTLAAEGIVAVIASPLLRARQTAELVAEAAGAPLVVDDRLGPGATAAALVAAAAAFDGPVATVGHPPDCSEIVAALTGDLCAFAPGSSVAVDLEGNP
jgi:phosphohistidine phosphatase